MVAAYIVFTQKVTDWRNGLRARRNDLDTGAVAHAVDSLLNFETVKYFGAEEREARRYDRAVEAYAAAAVKSENRSEEHTSELQSLMRISYAVLCLTKKNKNYSTYITHSTLSFILPITTATVTK